MRAIKWFLSVSLFCQFFSVMAQDVMTSFNPTTLHSDNLSRYTSYPYVREADVMWARTIWSRIDVREKMNLQFYYPEIPTEAFLDNRRNLINTLLQAIECGSLKAYQPGTNNDFGEIISYEEIVNKMGGGLLLAPVVNLEDGSIDSIPIFESPKTEQVVEFLVKELWFFNKNTSAMEVRIIGICPIFYAYRDGDVDELEPVRKKLFWIYYPDAREILSQQEVYNYASNDAEQRTYDDIFINRFFSSVIVQETNMYNNRSISEYTTGVDALLEAERIEETIFNFEQDVWNP